MLTGLGRHPALLPPQRILLIVSFLVPMDPMAKLCTLITWGLGRGGKVPKWAEEK